MKVLHRRNRILQIPLTIQSCPKLRQYRNHSPLRQGENPPREESREFANYRDESRSGLVEWMERGRALAGEAAAEAEEEGELHFRA